jgi:hypothetical protein
VWVRVDHAPGTLRGVLRERPETVHLARVVARVRGSSRVATSQLDLDRRRIAGGYFLRFSKSDARAATAAAARRVPVSLSVTQTVDVDADGKSDDRAAVAASRRVALATPATTIEPKDGRYQSPDNPNDYLQVATGQVVHFFFWSAINGPCHAGPGADVQAPIDPQTGRFSFTRTVDPFSVAADGRFRNATSALLNATITSSSCKDDLLNDFDLASTTAATAR